MQSVATIVTNGVPLRVYGTHTDPLFVANDVGIILGAADIHTTIQHYDFTRRVVCGIQTADGPRMTVMLTTRGLYKVVFKSDKPAAIYLQNWIFTELDEHRMSWKMAVTPPAIPTLSPATAADAATCDNTRDSISDTSLVPTAPVIMFAAPCHDITTFTDQPVVYLLHRHDVLVCWYTDDIISLATNHRTHPVTVVALCECRSTSVARAVCERIRVFVVSRGLAPANQTSCEAIKLAADDVCVYEALVVRYTDDANTVYDRIHDNYLRERELVLQILQARVRLAELIPARPE